MKKLWIALILLMLCGCTKEPGREMILSVDLDGDGKAEQLRVNYALREDIEVPEGEAYIPVEHWVEWDMTRIPIEAAYVQQAGWESLETEAGPAAAVGLSIPGNHWDTLLLTVVTLREGALTALPLPEPAEDPVMDSIRQALGQPEAKLGDMTAARQVTGRQGLRLRCPVIGQAENNPLVWVDILVNWDKADRPLILGWEKVQ